MSVNIFKNGILSKIAGAVGDAVPLINNFLTNQAGKGAADANTVYVLNNKIDELNSSLNSLDLKVSGIEKILVFKGNLSSSTGYTEVTTLDENIREKTTVVSIMCGSVGDLETNSGVVIKINTQTGLVRINNPVTQFVGYPYVLILAVTK